MDALTYEALLERINASASTPLEAVEGAVALNETLVSYADQIMDHFVRAARDGGESWTAIGRSLGVSRQAARQRFAVREAFKTYENLYWIDEESIRPRLRVCLTSAADIAARQGSAEIGTDHLLAGLMSEGVAAAILEKLGLSRSAIEQAALHLFQPSQQVVVDHPELSGEARSALAVAQTFNQDTRLGTEHLLAALVLDPGSRARRVLNELNVDMAAIKRELACYVDFKGGGRRHRKTA